MHPILKEYLTTNRPLDLIVEEHYDPSNFLEHVLLTETKVLAYKVPFDKALCQEIDQAVTVGHKDDTIFLLFMISSCIVLFNARETKKTETTVSILMSLLNDHTPSILRAFCMQISCTTNSELYKPKEILTLLQETVTIVDPTHPRYYTLFKNYALYLSNFGRLDDLNEKEYQILNSTIDTPNFLSYYDTKLLNSIVIGDHIGGLRLIKECHVKLKKDKQYTQLSIVGWVFGYKSILQILSGDLNPDHYENDSAKRMLDVYKNLLLNKIDDAINSYKNYLNTSDEEKRHFYELARYIPLHIEIFLGNILEARKIIENTWQYSEVVYLNDLFMVRILLLEGNYEEARQVFKRFMENVERYGAINRVLFELQFAKELKASHLFSLLSDWKNFSVKRPTHITRIKNSPTKELVGVELLIGRSFVLSHVKSQIKQYAPLQETILILGETGTGKELVARALHQEGLFSKEPFLAINCGALTDTLLESELFGYESGAFTGALRRKKGLFEAAGKGTVFLDEFGEISPKLQVSLLRVLESKEIRMIGGSENKAIECRIIVATNKNIKQAVDEKLFREDLYYRLMKLEIKLPSLRERLEDLPDLVNYFLQNNATTPKSVTEDFLEMISRYSWPGNIRELKNGVERLKILNPNKNIFDIEDLDSIQFQGDFIIPQKKHSPQENVADKNNNKKYHENKSVLNIIREGHLTPKQRIAYMKELFLEHKILTRSQIIKIINVHPITATQELKQLCKEGFILKKQPSKSPRSIYFEINHTGETNSK